EATALGVPSLPIVKIPVGRGLAADRSLPIGPDRADAALEEIIHILTTPAEKLVKEYRGKYPVDEIEQELFRPKTIFALETVKAPGSVEAASDIFYRRGWTDGLPIVPPTRESVERMLAYTDREPGDLIGLVSPRRGRATVEKIAVNAVMAGCMPEYFPVVVAAIQAMVDPKFNVYALQGTTNPIAPLTIVNGPIARELDINCRFNAFGQGWKSNATIGRAVRLVMMNIGGGTPGTADKAIQGQPGKYSFCAAENEEESPWEPLHVERGLSPTTSAVTMAGVCGTLNIIASGHGGTSAKGILSVIASSMVIIGCNNLCYAGEPVVALNPGHARIFANNGFSKDDVKRFLYDNARVPVSRIPPEGIPHFSHRRPKHDWNVMDARIPLAERWEDIVVLVVGAAGGHATFLPTFGEPIRSVTVPLCLKDGTPAKSVNDFKKKRR
ncbi:MAG: UGSC family (seleno)protein, partial [Chloroflexota bacterium]